MASQPGICDRFSKALPSRSPGNSKDIVPWGLIEYKELKQGILMPVELS